MRQKNIKYVNIEMMNEKGVITEIVPVDIKNYTNINLEIGSGKGNFITQHALDNPDKLYIALERNINVCYRIVEKKEELELENLIIILGDSKDLLTYVNKNSIDNLFLNFSDPWPKARHHKRRLTYKPFLLLYKDLLKKDGILQFRTDHLELFNDSLEYLDEIFSMIEVNRDYKSDKYFTEYEAKKSKIGNIYQYRGGIKHE